MGGGVVRRPTLRELVADFEQRGGEIWAEGMAIYFRPESAMTPQLAERLCSQEGHEITLELIAKANPAVGLLIDLFGLQVVASFDKYQPGEGAQ